MSFTGSTNLSYPPIATAPSEAGTRKTVKSLLDNFGDAKKISSFDTSKKAVDALLHNDIDILIHDGPIILMLASENDSKGLTTSTFLLTEEYLAWGIRKNDIELLHSANRFIDTYKQEGKLNSILGKEAPPAASKIDFPEWKEGEQFVKEKDGSIIFYIQKESPGKDKEANWLPAPDGAFYMVMRLYGPEADALEGKWTPPVLQKR